MLTTIALVLSALLAASLLELRRTKEIHHGYLGAVLCFVGLTTPGSHLLVVIAGLLLLLDDDVQHVWEAICKLTGRPVPNDFTPIHKLGSDVLLILENLWHFLTGIMFWRKSS